MQFRVVLPENVKSGQCIRIRCPDGTEADMNVPEGLKPGDSFIVDVQGATAGTGSGQGQGQGQGKKEVDTKSSDISTAASNKLGPLSLSSHQQKASSTATSATPGSAGNGANSGSNVTIARIVKKDVLYLRDFIAATIIGLMIGASIVLGFLIGVLSVTGPGSGTGIAGAKSGGAGSRKSYHYDNDPDGQIFLTKHKPRVLHPEDLRHPENQNRRVVEELDEVVVRGQKYSRSQLPRSSSNTNTASTSSKQ